MMNINQVNLVGTACSELMPSHKVKDEQFYILMLSIARNSRVYDEVPVMVSEKLITNFDVCGKRFSIEGNIRTYNYNDDQKRKLFVYTFADAIQEVGEDHTDCNIVYLSGALCKKPVYRTTPLGRHITDMILAVNRKFGKSDYIPCIVWGRNAAFMGNKDIGQKVDLNGRFQSRVYQKSLEGGTFYEKKAYEVSVSWIEEK